MSQPVPQLGPRPDSGGSTGAAGPAARPRWRTPWLMILLIVGIIALPIAEVALLITVGRQIGLWPTLGILILEGVLGGWLAKREGGRAWSALSAALESGRMPSGELADAALVLVGGTLLMLPGFITDVFGLVFLLPFTRPLARRALGWLVARQVRRTLGVDPAMLRARMSPGQTIPGETIPGETIPGETIPGETIPGEPEAPADR